MAWASSMGGIEGRAGAAPPFWGGVLAFLVGGGTLSRMRARRCPGGAGRGDLNAAFPSRNQGARRWSVQDSSIYTLMSFLNCTKQPPSLCFLLMTVGPALLFLAWFDRGVGPWARPLIAFGRVPLFYYLLPLPMIHGLCVLAAWW